MAKIDDYDIKDLPQEQVDFNDDVKTILNFGKYQKTVVTSPPTWTGRAGEEVYMITGATGRLYVCTSDNTSSNWKVVSTFTP